MPADASALRRGLTEWAGRVVADAARQTATSAPRDARTLQVRNNPGGYRRRPATGRVTSTAGTAARLRVDTYGWQWRPGRPARPFAPNEHHAWLTGRRFTHFDDPVLANRTQPWLGVTHFHPGDHRGCLCQAVDAPAPPDMAAWLPVLGEHATRALRSAAHRQPL